MMFFDEEDDATIPLKLEFWVSEGHGNSDEEIENAQNLVKTHENALYALGARSIDKIQYYWRMYDENEVLIAKSRSDAADCIADFFENYRHDLNQNELVVIV